MVSTRKNKEYWLKFLRFSLGKMGMNQYELVAPFGMLA